MSVRAPSGCRFTGTHMHARTHSGSSGTRRLHSGRRDVACIVKFRSPLILTSIFRSYFKPGFLATLSCACVLCWASIRLYKIECRRWINHNLHVFLGKEIPVLQAPKPTPPRAVSFLLTLLTYTVSWKLYWSFIGFQVVLVCYFSFPHVTLWLCNARSFPEVYRFTVRKRWTRSRSVIVVLVAQNLLCVFRSCLCVGAQNS